MEPVKAGPDKSVILKAEQPAVARVSLDQPIKLKMQTATIIVSEGTVEVSFDWRK